MADGGEGTLDLLIKMLDLEVVKTTVSDPLFRPLVAYYGRQSTTAYIEMAQASGLPLLSEDERNPLRTTSLGTGELIRHAIQNGAQQVYIFIGGSATNDAGIGMAQALGYQFLNQRHQAVAPTGQSLAEVATIRLDQTTDLTNIKFFVVSDVDNPLYGPTGAAQVYGPQKGADPVAVNRLEQGLINIADRIAEFTCQDVRHVPGSGAAGGFGAGALAFLGAERLPGAPTVIDLCGGRAHFETADLVISGEGKVDEQTLHGKVVKGVSDVCRTQQTPLGIICGTLALDQRALAQLDVWRAYAVKEEGMSLSEALAHTEERVEALAHQMMVDFVN